MKRQVEDEFHITTFVLLLRRIFLRSPDKERRSRNRKIIFFTANDVSLIRLSCDLQAKRSGMMHALDNNKAESVFTPKTSF